MAISGVSNIDTNYYSSIASGSKLQSAANGAAELAISEKMDTQANGFEVGERNSQDAKSVLKVADGAMSQIVDDLTRMRELAVQASNSMILSDDDKKLIQEEIDGIKGHISDVANNTEFNKKKLLDGSFEGHVASSPDGSGMDVELDDSTLQALGIADFDVTGDFSIDTIDQALAKVSNHQSSIGAQSNSLDFAISSASISRENLTSASSRLEDTDIGQAASELQKQKLLQNYQIIMQKKQQEDQAKKYAGLI